MIPSLLLTLATSALASSHREAPAIALDPAADITDFYMFISPEDPTKLVMIMNVNPLELPGGGPNYNFLDPEVLYEIHIDNEGDGEEDLSYQFTFETDYQMPETFLYNLGDIADSANLNMVQTYNVRRVNHDTGGVLNVLTGATVAPVNVGLSSGSGGYNPESSTPGSITTDHINLSSAGRYFVGPRQEGFYVDLERTFDLLNLNHTDNTNTLLGYNVHSIAMEVPLRVVTRDGRSPLALRQNEVIAAWCTTSRKSVRTLLDDGSDPISSGDYVQVARLGNPLVNEVVIPIQDKNVFSTSHPRDDAQFLDYVTDPLLIQYMNAILGVAIPSDVSADMGLGIGGREDLVLAFLTGHSALGTMPGGYALGGAIPGETGKYFGAFEALRINLTGAGFGQWPDGRGVEDDVVDTALSGLAGLLIDGTTVSDGVDSTGLYYLDTFPFLGDPWAGDDHPQGFHDE